MQTNTCAVVALLLALGATGAARGVEVIQPLVPFELLAPSGTTNRLQLTLRETASPLRLSDTETTSLTGSFTGNIRTDVVGDSVTVTGIEFTGGQFALSNVNFNISIIFVGNITASTSNLQGTIDTIPPFGDVVDGTFNASDHEITVNNGTIAVGGSLVDPASVDLAETPLALTADATGTVVLTELGMSGNTRDYRARITIPVDTTVDIEGQPAQISASGNIIADGFFSIDFGLAGDFNGDGVVDAADYTVWRDTLGTTGPGLAADANGDFTVDAADYAAWRQNFGQASSGTLASAAAVPEPSAVAIAGLLVCCAATIARRRHTGRP